MIGLVSRKKWGAAPPKGTPTKVNWSKGVAIRVHHTADHCPTSSGNEPTAKSSKAQNAWMRKEQDFHQNTRGWSDIAYSYVITPTGRVLVGRGYEVLGAHTIGHNEDIGICFGGNFENDKLTIRARVAYWRLRRHLRKRGARIIGTYPHCKSYATSCPGKDVKKKLNLRCG